MAKLEVYFDYTCPYCFRGHEYLMALSPQYPDIDIDWRPCEAHPRPETYGKHSDLCARGMYFALEHGADLAEYHNKMYNAALNNQVDIEDVNVIAEITCGLLNSNELRKALAGSLYEDRLIENNRLAWEVYGFPAVPSYRMDGKFLQSVLEVGVSKSQLATFLGKAEH